MDTPTIVVARCDGLGAKLIDSNIDPLDHPWIMGINDPFNTKTLVTFPEAGKL
jgi:isocitrate lyase